jgi:sialidase-1
LIIPFNEGPYYQWNNFAVFSDDRGQNWKCGQDVPGAFVADEKLGQRSQINEVQMVELSDGSVRLNSRQFAGAKVRRGSISRDGGKTWSRVHEFPELTDPSCMASTIRYSFADGTTPGQLLHSGPDSTKRERGTIYLSTDDGKTWPVRRVLYPGSFAYSVLTRFADGTVGCLFEADNYGRIVFARFPLEWLSVKR